MNRNPLESSIPTSWPVTVDERPEALTLNDVLKVDALYRLAHLLNSVALNEENKS